MHQICVHMYNLCIHVNVHVHVYLLWRGRHDMVVGAWFAAAGVAWAN